MYSTGYSSLERRISDYSSGSCGRSSLNSTPILSYSRLEMKAAPEIMQTYSEQRIINLDKPLEVIKSPDRGSVLQKYSKQSGYNGLKQGYSAGSYSNSFYNNGKLMPQTVERFNPDSFLSDRRAPVQFIGDAAEIKDIISEAFIKTTGLYFPSDIVVRVCNDEQMRHFNPGWEPNVSGFCFNRKGFGASEIFVLQGELDKVMLTVGHEIGHCLSIPLENKRNEEAKAFAFSLAWAKKIKEHNIGDLGMNIDLNPAKNGLHDVALGFVFKMLKKGGEALDIYRKLVKKELSMEAKDGLFIGG